MFAHHHPHSHYLSILGKLSLLGPICTNWRKLCREVFPDVAVYGHGPGPGLLALSIYYFDALELGVLGDATLTGGEHPPPTPQGCKFERPMRCGLLCLASLSRYTRLSDVHRRQ